MAENKDKKVKTSNSNKLTWEEIENLVRSEVSLAEEYSQTRVHRRQESWDRYYGRKLGNEVKGRSQFIPRDTLETIEWMMPFFMRTFFSGDPKVELKVKNQPKWVGRALMKQILEDINESTPSMFKIGYQWVKDALITDTAFVKPMWSLSTKKVNVEFDKPITSEQMQQLLTDVDVEVKTASQFTGMAGNIEYRNVSIVATQTLEDKLDTVNVPHWEFLTVKEANDINDEHPKGHKTEITMDFLRRMNREFSEPGKPFFKFLDDIKGGSPSRTGHDVSIDNTYVGQDSETFYDTTDNEKGAKQSIELVEWCSRYEVDGDGFLKDVVAWSANGTLIRWEENRDEFIPFSSIVPIIDPYRFHGISYADLLIDLQNLHTALIRSVLDNFAWGNLGRYIVDPEAQIDMNSLLNAVPGGAIFGRIDGIKEIQPKPFQSSSLSILEYVRGLKEDRTGVNRNTQGSGSDVHRTAQGVMQLQSASMQRLELIGRIFAETGFVDYYKKCAILYQKNLRKPIEIELDGQVRQLTPENIQGKIITTVNMGVAASVGVQEAQKIKELLEVVFSLNQHFPGLLSPEKIHNISSKYIVNLGFKDVEFFIQDIQTYVNELAQKQQVASAEQQKIQQLQMALEQAKIQIDASKVQSKFAVDSQANQLGDIENQRDTEIANIRIDQQRSNSLLSSLMDKYKADLTSSTALEVARINNEDKGDNS